MAVLIVGALVLVGVVAWVLRRAADAPIMRERVNAGSDRYFAERDREGGDGGVWDADAGGDGGGDD